MNPTTAQANRLWAKLLVEELVRNGVDFFCLAPGSRSTPLVAAIAENPKARTLVHFDERGTAFAALGYARVTGRPAAWVTTSGTAVANGLPAVVEASTDTVPMILLTADRPPELRQTGANQTILQPDIFGSYARWSFDLPAPDALGTTVAPASVLTTVDQAVYRARRAPRGPVHLNLMFREPFLPGPDEEELPAPSRWSESNEPYTRYAATEPAVDKTEAETLWEELRAVGRGLIVAGRLEDRARGEAALRLAETLNWPLLPDVGSQVRLGTDSDQHAAHYDALLAGEEFAAAHAPEAVIQLGGRPLSKRLERFLTTARPDPYVVVRENPFRLDPGHTVTHSIEAGVAAFCAALQEAASRRPPADVAKWTKGWREASLRAGAALERSLMGGDTGELSEPFVARYLSRHVPAGHGLFVASSLPIRELDAFAAPDGPLVLMAANRGASGIDGTVATAAGYARGSGRPVTLFIGDLALLYDLNSLAMLRDLPVTVVALNNDGGGIFDFLPVAERRVFFEPYFGTPHGLGFEDAAAMFGMRYEQPRSAPELERAYRAAVDGGAPVLIEVETDRKANVALHERLLSEVARAAR